jgi:hypothetical protein
MKTPPFNQRIEGVTNLFVRKIINFTCTKLWNFKYLSQNYINNSGELK